MHFEHTCSVYYRKVDTIQKFDRPGQHTWGSRISACITSNAVVGNWGGTNSRTCSFGHTLQNKHAQEKQLAPNQCKTPMRKSHFLLLLSLQSSDGIIWTSRLISYYFRDSVGTNFFFRLCQFILVSHFKL